MEKTLSIYEEKVRSFWDRYVQSLHESGIKPPFDRWAAIRAEHYISAYPDRKLAEQSPENVNAYLADLGRKPGLKDWQFRQAVDARSQRLSKVERETPIQAIKDWQLKCPERFKKRIYNLTGLDIELLPRPCGKLMFS